MKQILIYLTALAIALSLGSCYEDKSTSASVTGKVAISFPEDIVAEDGIATIEAANGSILTLEPEVSQPDVATPDLSYEWKVSLYPISTSQSGTSLLGTDRKLERKIALEPSASYYTLALYVTDNRTGIQYIGSCRLYVTSGLGDGVIVADTQDDATGDLTLVRNKYVSAGYTKATEYKRNYYSLNNGAAYPEVIRSVAAGIYGSYADASYPIYLMSDNNIELLYSSTYKVQHPLNKLFLSSDNAQFSLFGFDSNCMYAVRGENIYAATFLSSLTQFGDPINYLRPSAITPKKTANKHLLTFRGEMSFISEDTGTLYSSLGAFQQFQLIAAEQGSGSSAYDPTMFTGYTELGSCIGRLSPDASAPVFEHFHIMKAPNGTVAFYGIMSQTDEDLTTTYQTTRACSATACPNIAEAFTFDGCYSRDVIYYATSSTVYAAILGTSTASTQAVFTAPAGSVITCMRVFHDASSAYNMSYDSSTMSASHDNQLLVATYNAATKLGTLYLLPINSASGVLGSADEERTFTGFGRITALASQGKQ